MKRTTRMLAGNSCVCQMKGIYVSQPSARTVCLVSFCPTALKCESFEIEDVWATNQCFL